MVPCLGELVRFLCTQARGVSSTRARVSSHPGAPFATRTVRFPQALSARQEATRAAKKTGAETGRWLKSLAALGSRLRWRSHFAQKLHDQQGSMLGCVGPDFRDQGLSAAQAVRVHAGNDERCTQANSVPCVEERLNCVSTTTTPVSLLVDTTTMISHFADCL